MIVLLFLSYSVHNNKPSDSPDCKNLYIKALENFSIAQEHYEKCRYDEAGGHFRLAEIDAMTAKVLCSTESKKKEMEELIDQCKKMESEIDKKKKELEELVKKCKIEIGMTKEQVLESWGYPDDINKTITSSTVYEQWCYETPHVAGAPAHAYLYFENGILTSWQD